MLYQEFRPQTFNQVIGQPHIVEPVLNALIKNEYPHSYLLVGPRGLGKTTIGRLIAKYLNCMNPAEDVCNECVNCKALTEGNFPDLLELDAASNRGIDNIRSLIERVHYSATYKVKVYIIDECHMLTREASNALLKVLEEPPSGVVFVLCTTEEEKILATIKSRCQTHRYRLISPDLAVSQLQMIANTLNLEIPAESLKIIAAEGKGSVRDSISLFEKVKASGSFDLASVKASLGRVEGIAIAELVEALAYRDTVKAFAQIKKLSEENENLPAIMQELELWFQNLLNLSVGVIVDSPYIDTLENHAKMFTTKEILQFFDSFTKWRTRILPISKLTFEVAAAEFLQSKQPVKPVENSESSINWLTGKRTAKWDDITKDEEKPAEEDNREPDF